MSIVEPVAALDLHGAFDISTALDSFQVTSPSANWAPGQTLVIRRPGNGAAFIGQIQFVSGSTAYTTQSVPFAGTALTAFWGTNDHDAWQAALNAAPPGSTVTVNQSTWRSLVLGQLVVPRGIEFIPTTLRALEPTTNPIISDAWGPTLGLVQSAQASILLGGHGATVGTGILYGLNQVNRTARNPNVFGPMVEVIPSVAGWGIGAYFANAYIGAKVRGGRGMFNMPRIGAFKRGVIVDEAYDFINGKLSFSPYWNLCEGAGFPTPGGLDDFVLTSGGLWCVEVQRCDGFNIDLIQGFGCCGGVLFGDSPLKSQGVTCGHGQISKIQMDAASIGVQCTAVEAEGLQIGSLDMNGNNIGQGTPGRYGVWLSSGGSTPPNVAIGTWSVHNAQAKRVDVGTLSVPGTNPG